MTIVRHINPQCELTDGRAVRSSPKLTIRCAVADFVSGCLFSQRFVELQAGDNQIAPPEGVMLLHFRPSAAVRLPMRVICNSTCGLQEWTENALGTETPLQQLMNGSRIMGQKQGSCCSSPGSMCYWFSVSLIAWGALSVVGIFWCPLHASAASTILLAAAIGCFANWHRNRTFHCAITGPLFLIAGLVFLLAGEGAFQVDPSWIWPFVLVGAGIAFLLEWRYTKGPTSRG